MLLYWIDDDVSKLHTRTEINLKILEGMNREDIHFAERSVIAYTKEIEF